MLCVMNTEELKLWKAAELDFLLQAFNIQTLGHVIYKALEAKKSYILKPKKKNVKISAGV